MAPADMWFFSNALVPFFYTAKTEVSYSLSHSFTPPEPRLLTPCPILLHHQNRGSLLLFPSFYIDRIQVFCPHIYPFTCPQGIFPLVIICM